MRSISFLIPLLFFLSGCDLLQDEYNVYDYTIEQRRDCFCPQSGVWAKLYIKADSVSKAIRISDNYNLSYIEYRRYKSIKGLFDEIALRDTGRYEVKIVMDTKINYPAYVYFNPKPTVVSGDTMMVIKDAQLSYTTRNYSKTD